MSYNTISVMARDGDLQQRFIACAAQEGIENPQNWVLTNIWQLVSSPGLAGSYSYAVDTTTINQNPNVGQRDDVINDATILSAVQALRTEQNSTAPA